MRLRDVIFWMHLCLGVAAGLVVAIMAVTGTMLAFEPQIVSFSERDVRAVSVPQGAPRLSLNVIADKVFETKPDAKISAIRVKAEPDASVFVGLGGEGVRYIDPYTGKVLGASSKVHKFMHQVEDWHRWFALEGKLKPVGQQIKGVANIIVIVMIVSGIYLWWPKIFSWPGIKNIVLFNGQAKGKARDWNWHNVIGFWSSPILLTITLTGLVMSYSWANGFLYKMAGSRPPVPAEKTTGSLSASEVSSINLDAMATAAQTQEPNWKTITIRMSKPGTPVTVMIQEKSSPYPSPRSTLKLDPSTAQIKSWEPLSGQSRGQQLSVFVRYLHTGEVYGIVGQTVACAGAVGALFLIWTGFAMAWRRFFEK